MSKHDFPNKIKIECGKSTKTCYRSDELVGYYDQYNLLLNLYPR